MSNGYMLCVDQYENKKCETIRRKSNGLNNGNEVRIEWSKKD